MVNINKYIKALLHPVGSPGKPWGSSSWQPNFIRVQTFICKLWSIYDTYIDYIGSLVQDCGIFIAHAVRYHSHELRYNKAFRERQHPSAPRSVNE